MKQNFIYELPEKVTSPKDYVQEVTPIFDGTKEKKNLEDVKKNHEHLDHFSLAILKWKDEYTLGIRWNLTMREANDPEKQNGTKTCKGIPVSFTHPVWFVLPKQLHESVLVSMKSLIDQAKYQQINDTLGVRL
jgi:hypothetical protein